ncbi:hypothetical protein TNCV_1658331 [Trichonephila clavipes]|nr:hypothetical protein TNCV_1658331 [Trichonephila clavipes]
MLKLGNDTFPCLSQLTVMAPAFFVELLICSVVMCKSSFVARLAVIDYIINNSDRFKVSAHDNQGNSYPSREAYETAMFNPITYGSASELQASSEVFFFFFCRFQIFCNGHLLAVYGEHFETVKNVRFNAKT